MTSYILKRDLRDFIFSTWIGPGRYPMRFCEAGLGRLAGKSLMRVSNAARVRLTWRTTPAEGYRIVRFREDAHGGVLYTLHETATPNSQMMGELERFLTRLHLQNSTVYVKGEVYNKDDDGVRG